MATFYVLPPRSMVETILAEQFQRALPGLSLNSDDANQLLEMLSTTLLGRADTYLVFREELDLSEPAAQALANGFGAEPGDLIIEMQPGSKPGQFQTNRWSLPEAA
jgi:hypothetical protein